LFKAACSELSTEVKNNRRAADEVTREQRMRLQHEVDILSQSMNQELATLNDTFRGTFNDRKMAVREEQKALENSVRVFRLTCLSSTFFSCSSSTFLESPSTFLKTLLPSSRPLQLFPISTNAAEIE
jgi:hypothetical protein